MKGIQIQSYIQSLDDLSTNPSLPPPTPSPTEYLIRISAAATNFFDILQLQGKYQHQPPFPWISGSEFSGTVVSVPTSSSSPASPPRFKPGDRVFGAAQGAYAELIACPEVSLLPVPDGWSFVEAAGLYVTAPTSYGALVTRAGVKAGDWVLIHAAAGGVGLAAVQIAKAMGATVIATASTREKLAIAASFGADHVVGYGDDGGDGDWVEKAAGILKMHGRAGVDVVFDPVGLITPSLKLAAWNARLLVVGFAGGKIEKVAVNRVLLKNVSVVGIHWGMYAKYEPGTVGDVWEGLFGLIREGRFRPTVYRDREYVGLESVKFALKAVPGQSK